MLPLAIEYPFWDERLPETLLHFGRPLQVQGEAAGEIEERLKPALLEAMEELKGLAVARDAANFTVLREGRVGTGGFYEMGQRAWARIRGRRYQAEHTALARKDRG